MSKIWITRKELKALVREASTDQESSDSSAVVYRGRVDKSRPVQSKSLRDPTAKKAYTKAELAQGIDQTGDEPSDVLPPSGKTTLGPKGSSKLVQHSSGRLKYAGSVGKDPTTSQPFTRAELSKGEDVSSIKSPGFIDRVKGLFKKKPEDGFEDAPSYWPSSQRQQFHRERAIGMRDRAKQYGKMFTDANRSNDEKKKAYAKKMHGFYAKAAASHEKALKGAK